MVCYTTYEPGCQQRTAVPSAVPPEAALAGLVSPAHGPKVLSRRGKAIVLARIALEYDLTK